MPVICSPFIAPIDAFLSRLRKNSLYNLLGEKSDFEGRVFGRGNIDSYYQNTKPLLSFSAKEHANAITLLKKINVTPGEQFVCLLVRSADYNSDHPVWNSVPERNSDIKTYEKACYFLAEKGYRILRMGKNVKNKFEIDHPNFIDYAQNDIRCDFLDIYLAAHCSFFISTNNGLDCVAEIFRRPILVTNSPILAAMSIWYPYHVIIFKLIRCQQTGRLINLDEYFEIFSRGVFENFNLVLRENKLCIVDNTDQELLEAVIEMVSRLTGSWVETEYDIRLQHKFLEKFRKLAPNPNGEEYSAKIGRNFLLSHSGLL